MSTDIIETGEVKLNSYCGPKRVDSGIRVRYQITKMSGDMMPYESFVTMSVEEAVAIAKAIIKNEKSWKTKA